MGGMLDFELNCPGLSPDWVNSVVLERDTSNSQCLLTSSGELSGKPSIPSIPEGVVILLVAI